MINTLHTPAEELLAEEETLRLEQIDESVTYRIGAHIAGSAFHDGRTVMVVVCLDDWLVYKTALPGTSINNDIVIEGKLRVARMAGHSSLWARNRHLDAGTTFEAATGLCLPEYAPFGGAVPRVSRDGDRQGWVIVSGLTQEENHDLGVQASAQPRAAGSRHRYPPHKVTYGSGEGIRPPWTDARSRRRAGSELNGAAERSYSSGDKPGDP